MESMAYFTAGIIDQYEEPDMAVEAAMVKVRAAFILRELNDEGFVL